MRPVRLGVVGNMSPAADELFQSYLRAYAEARTDQEHPCVIVVKNPDIPDRTAYILGQAPDPADEVLLAIKLLEGAGASFIAMPCNTVHYCYDAIQARTKLFVFHAVNEAAADIAATGAVTRAGLLATEGTIRSRLYHDAMEAHGISLIVPDADTQRLGVHAAIYGEDGRGGLKAGEFSHNIDALCAAVKTLRDSGAEAIVLGCTELPLALDRLRAEFPDIAFIDPMRATAKRCLAAYRLAEALALRYIALGAAPLARFPACGAYRVAPIDEIAEYVAVLSLRNLAGEI